MLLEKVTSLPLCSGLRKLQERKTGVGQGQGDVLIGCLFSYNCRNQSFQGVVFVLAQGRDVGY